MIEIVLMLMKTAQAVYPQEDWGLVGATVVTGLIVVFLILIILVCVLWLIGKVLGGSGKKKAVESKPAQTASAAPVVMAAEEPEEVEDDAEVIAVIAAAIAAYSENDGVQYRITKISKKSGADRSNWRAAGIYQNTRPFDGR